MVAINWKRNKDNMPPAAVLVLVGCVLLLAPARPVWCGQNILQKLVGSISENHSQNLLRKEFDRLNKLLTSTVDTDDVDKNMETVRKWIRHYVYEIKGRGVSGSLKALSLLESLSDVDPVPCSRSSHDTLVANDMAAREFLQKLRAKEKPKRRIDKIIYHYAIKEASECEFYYMSEFELAGEKMTPSNYVKLRGFITDLIASRVDKNMIRQYKLTNSSSLLDKKPIEASKFAEELKFHSSFWDLQDGQIAYKWLASFTGDDPVGGIFLNKIRYGGQWDIFNRAQVNEKQLIKLFRQHLVEPCKEYVEKLHGAFSNNLTLVKMNDDANHSNDPRIVEFYKHSAYWHGCRRFLSKQNVVFNNLVRWINRNGQTVTVSRSSD